MPSNISCTQCNRSNGPGLAATWVGNSFVRFVAVLLGRMAGRRKGHGPSPHGPMTSHSMYTTPSRGTRREGVEPKRKHVTRMILQRQVGTWCNGNTSAPHAEGPGFNPQCAHTSAARALCFCSQSSLATNMPSTCGLVAMTSAQHAEGRRFDPGQVYIWHG